MENGTGSVGIIRIRKILKLLGISGNRRFKQAIEQRFEFISEFMEILRTALKINISRLNK